MTQLKIKLSQCGKIRKLKELETLHYLYKFEADFENNFLKPHNNILRCSVWVIERLCEWNSKNKRYQ